jgi:hypothetical protein
MRPDHFRGPWDFMPMKSCNPTIGRFAEDSDFCHRPAACRSRYRSAISTIRPSRKEPNRIDSQQLWRPLLGLAKRPSDHLILTLTRLMQQPEQARQR